MANEWKSYRLEELCEFINGFAFKSTDYVPPFSDTIEVFRMGYIQRGGGFKEDDSPVFVPRKYGRNLEKYFLKPGDVTIAMTDMKDRVAILGNTAWIRDAGRFVVNQRVGCMRVSRPDLLDPRFLYFYSNWSPHVDYLRSRANSGVQVNLSTSAIKDSELTIPPLAEQKAIAAVLGALDDKIELNRRMNATLEAMARALFQSWFVDFDPVRAKLDGRPPAALDPATAALFPAAFQDSEAGHIPKGWTVGKVSDLAMLNRGAVNPGDFPAETFDHFSLPAFDNGRTPKMELGSAIMSNKFTVTPNSVLLSKLNPHIPRIWLPDLHASRRSVCSTEFMVACSKPSVSREYLFSLFTSSAFASIYGTLVTGTTGSHQRIHPESVLDMKIVIPSAALIQAFTDIAKPMFDRINRNTEQSRTLANLRDTLLPKLLSGELSVAETVAKSATVQTRKETNR